MLMATMTDQQFREYKALPCLARKVFLRSMQISMMRTLGNVEPIVHEMLCRAIVVDVSQAELALLAARQMCESREVRSAIDDLLHLAAYINDVANDNLITGDIA